jgi:hypothetical protein
MENPTFDGQEIDGHFKKIDVDDCVNNIFGNIFILRKSNTTQIIKNTTFAIPPIVPLPSSPKSLISLNTIKSYIPQYKRNIILNDEETKYWLRTEDQKIIADKSAELAATPYPDSNWTYVRTIFGLTFSYRYYYPNTFVNQRITIQCQHPRSVSITREPDKSAIIQPDAGTAEFSWSWNPNKTLTIQTTKTIPPNNLVAVFIFW